MRKMKKTVCLLLAGVLLLGLAACGQTDGGGNGSTLVYASGDYTRINPAMDEHGEINILLFNGLTAHDGNNQVVPGLAKSWDYDPDAYTYTFHLEENVQWHDGQPFTAEDVKFTIEAIMDPENGSENAPNYEDVEEITVIDDHTVAFRLAAPNVAFLDYMTMAVLPRHLLEGEDMQTSGFFRAPVGTGPYKLAAWDEGQAITLEKNEDYFKGAANIDRIIFKIVPDDNAQALQMQSGELDLALLTPKDARNFEGREGYTVYDMKTSDYAGTSSISGTPTGPRTGTSFPPSAAAWTVRPFWTPWSWAGAWWPTAPFSGTSTTTKTWSATTTTPIGPGASWRTPGASWAKTASMSGAVRRSASSSA